MDRFDCGRRHLLPLIFALASIKYDPETVLELAMIHRQFQPGHRQHRRSTLALDNKRYDRRIEEVNWSQKSHLSNGIVTPNRVEQSSLIIQGAKIYRQAAPSSVNMNNTSRKAEKTYVNYSPEISKISSLFTKMGVWKNQRDRQQPFQLGNQDRAIDDGCTMESIMSYGKSGMTDNIPGILEGGNRRPTHPPSVYWTSLLIYEYWFVVLLCAQLIIWWERVFRCECIYERYAVLLCVTAGVWMSVCRWDMPTGWHLEREVSCTCNTMWYV